MSEYLAPGVFVEEMERGPRPIEGVPTTTCAFLGETERGPVKPRLVTSYVEYVRLFGDVFGPDKYLPYAVKAFFDNGGRRAYIARIVGDLPVGDTGMSEATLGVFTVRANGPGTASDRIWARIDPCTAKIDGNPVGFRLRVFYWDRTVAGVPFDPIDDPNAATLPKPSLTEDFDDLRIEPDSPSYWEKRVNNGNSSLVTLIAPGPVTVPPAGGNSAALTGGDNGAGPLTSVHYEGAQPDADKRTGLDALLLDPYRDVAIVSAPGAAPDIVQKVITHCENHRFRFAVIDSPPAVADPSKLDPRSSLDDTKYAAFYYPWIVVSEPRTGNRIKVPPSGAICGVYALTDNTRGVWKAPANEVVAGALDLEYDVTHGTQELLNPRGVNVIRRFPGRGIRVWGARTMSSDPLWKYINVRRLFIFLEASICNSTRWVVFEPNDPKLWARVKQTITLFLRSQWREGALFGDKEEEAFSVAIGRETMTEDDILNGRLIADIGIAPVRPAEFVIFRVYQKTQEAKD